MVCCFTELVTKSGKVGISGCVEEIVLSRFEMEEDGKQRSCKFNEGSTSQTEAYFWMRNKWRRTLGMLLQRRRGGPRWSNVGGNR